MDGDARELAALVEAESLREMFEDFALKAVERRIAYSIDRNHLDDAMFFLDVYRFVNGGDILQPPPPASPAASESLPFRRPVSD